MLSAKRKSDGQTVLAYFENKSNGPFFCHDCNDEVVLKTGRRKVEHFAHAVPLSCRLTVSESELHRRCKKEIYEALLREPNVQNVALERALGPIRPDITAYINGVPVAIEVQISNLSIEAITERTIWYHRKGIYVLWLLQWTPKLDAKRYSPKQWEKWIHTAYFGRVYYWTKGLEVVSYTFEPSLKSIPKRTWFSREGKRMTAGGFAVRTRRHRTPVRCETLNLVRDFGPKQRFWWEGGDLKVPDARLFTARGREAQADVQ